VAQSVERLSYGLDELGSVLDGGNDGIFPLRYRVQTGSGTNLASFLMGTGSSFLVGKAARA
jgi:hypothetical protein